MVLPGARTDPRTPGGMPDSGTVNPGGPMPSMPKMGPGPGPTVPGEPDPARIEEIFTQYTTGQITREDLINQLHSFSEGEGGILGLLEGMEQQPEQPGQPGGQPGSQPVGSPGSIPPQPQPQPANIQNGQAISPGAASTPIPPLEEPLDARHQQISMMLQGYGLGPADADQMASILNPHEAGHRRVWSDDEGLWADEYDDAAKQKAAIESPSGGIAWDPTLTGRTSMSGWQDPKDTGSAAAEMRAQAGLGIDAGSSGGGYVRRYVPPAEAGGEGSYKTSFIGDKDLLQADKNNPWMSQQAAQVREGATFAGSERAWTPADISAADRRAAETMPTISGQYDIDAPTDSSWAQSAVTPNEGDPNPTGDGTVWDSATGKYVKPAVKDPTKGRKQGDPHPDGSGWTWDSKQGKYVAPRKAGTQKYTGNVHPAFTGMPEGYGGIGWGTAIGMAFAGKLGAGREKDWDKDVYIDNQGFSWPSKQAFSQFNKHLEEAFPDSHGKLTDDKRPVIWTAEGRKNPEFQGWGEDGKPQFGLPGQIGMESFFGIEVSDGTIFYFETAEDADAFNAAPYNEPVPLPGGGFFNHRDSTITGAPEIVVPGSQVIPLDGSVPLPDGYKWSYDDNGQKIVIKIDDGSQLGTDGKGNIIIPAPEGTGDGLGAGDGLEGAEGGTGTGTEDPYSGLPGYKPSISGDLDLRGAGNFPMMDDFLQQIDLGQLTGNTQAGLTGAITSAITALEVQKSKGDMAQHQRTSDVVVDSLDRAAVTLRAQLDRDLQSGVAMGEIEKKATLAKQIEANKAIFEQAALSGIVPTVDSATGLAKTGIAGTDGADQTLAGRQVTMTETEKLEDRKMQMASLFGAWLGDGVPTSSFTDSIVKTLEGERFGLTKALAEAEITGKIPTDMTGAGGNTLSAKRLVWEEDVARANSNTQAELASNQRLQMGIDLQIANSKTRSAELIASGNLAEAVQARKDATALASEKLELERNKMKLDTLASLANPATYLFAVRYGLLDQIGGALGIDFGDDAISSRQLPKMVEPGSFPSLTEFQRATPAEREIMLAEVASSGGFTTDEAIRRIMEGAPGGADIRRTSLVGVSR